MEEEEEEEEGGAASRSMGEGAEEEGEEEAAWGRGKGRIERLGGVQVFSASFLTLQGSVRHWFLDRARP